MKIVDQILIRVDKSDLDSKGTLIIPEGVTSIGSSACSNISELKNVKMPNSVTRILDDAFDNCQNLETVEFSTHLEVIGREVFRNCSSLKRIEIPNSVKNIKEYAFGGCDNLEIVKLSAKLEEIADFLFDHCKSLKTVVFGEKIKKVGNFAFNICSSLEEINFPDSLEEIGIYSFSGCDTLQKIIFPKDLKKIGDSSFTQCRSLKSVILNENLEVIEIQAFSGCNNIEEIYLPSNLKSIDVESFGSCYNIREISTIWGKETLKESNPKNVMITYLYLYANHLLKEKYENIDAFLANPSIQSLYQENIDILFKKTTIEKFKNLYRVLRKTYDIDSDLFRYLKVKTTEEFSYSIWNEIKDIIPWKDYPLISSAFAEILEVFGVFHKDEQQFQRIKKLKELMNEKVVTLTEESYQELLRQNPSLKDKIEAVFQKEQRKYYTFEKKTINEEFQIYLKFQMDEEAVKVIKKLTGTYGKQINDFFRKNYKETRKTVYVLDKRKKTDGQVEDALFKADLYGYINFHNLNRIFTSCKESYNEDFCQFLLDNLKTILEDDILQMQIWQIREFFLSMKKHYLYQAGSSKISLKQALDYIDSESFDYHRGCYELQKEAQKAGIIDQNRFNYYQSLYEQIERKKRILIPRSNIYEINGYTIKAELLRKDDPFSMLVGETNYTNCCQVYDGIGHNCMNHAICSPDGGIFVTRLLKDGNWILLTESWDWQNNNLYCHDNIETTNFFKKSEESLKEAVAKVLIEDAKFIIEKSNQEVEKYIEKKMKEQNRLPEEIRKQRVSDLEALKRRSIIKIITVGTGNQVLDLDKYFSTSIDVDEELFIEGKKFTLKNFQPIEYDESKPYFNPNHSAYSDAKTTQYIILGSLKNLVLDHHQIEAIYRDERRVIKEEQEEIRDYTIYKISQIEKEAYKEFMLEHQNSILNDYQEDQIIYLGEDWYLIFEYKEDYSIYISDLAKMPPSIEDEKGIQVKEIISTLHELVSRYETVEAVLREKTSYLLYLMNLKLGIIEQIGEDISYSYQDSENKRIVSKEEQEEILKNRNQIRNDEENQRMHKVLFKKKEKNQVK